MVRKDLLYKAGSKALTFFIYFHPTAEDDSMPHLSRIQTFTYVVAALFSAVAIQAQVPGAPVPISAIGYPPAYSWNAAAGASSYTLQVSSDYYFSTTVFSQAGITGTTLTLSASDTTLLRNAFGSGISGIPGYWRVDAVNASGASGWSSIASYPTPGYCTYENYEGPSNVISNAAPNDSDIQMPVTLSWLNNQYECLTSPQFSLQVATNSEFSSLVIDTGNLNGAIQPSSNITPAFLYSDLVGSFKNNTTYFWRVRVAGGMWLDTFQFTTAPLMPATPFLTAPTNNASNLPTTISFSWSKVSEATTYALQLSTVSLFSPTILNQTRSTTESITIGGIEYASSYYWHVDATNAEGTSAWSAVWSFNTTPSVPAAPMLISPGNDTSLKTDEVYMSWESVAGATEYTVQISQSSGFGTTSLNLNDSSSSANVSYRYWIGDEVNYWRVKASNAGGTGPWSSIWSFDPLTLPVLPVKFNELLSSAVSFTHSMLYYNLKTSMQVEIVLYDILGKNMLNFSRLQSSGSYSLSLKNRNLPAGVYFLQFKAGAMQKRMKIVLSN
jgi:hypothetical protein